MRLGPILSIQTCSSEPGHEGRGPTGAPEYAIVDAVGHRYASRELQQIYEVGNRW